MTRPGWGAALLWIVLTAAASGQAGRHLTLTVQESGGIRRTQFPTTARVQFPQGALDALSRLRLVRDGSAVPSQATAETRWPDGSIRDVILDFNVSLGPGQSQAYELQYGGEIMPPPVTRGLSVVEEPDAVQVGNVRFSKKGVPLLASVTYRDEAIGAGSNGLVVTDARGIEHDLSAVTDLKFDVPRQGPLLVVLRWAGTMRLDGNSPASVVVTAEMPSSKSWVKLSAHVDDPGRRVRGLAFRTPLVLGPLPWTWDFGTSQWTYGSFRNATDAVRLTDAALDSTRQWRVSAGPKGREQPNAAGRGASSSFGGWAHLQGAKEAVAFAIDHAPEMTGAIDVAFEGEGHASVRLTPRIPSTRHDLVVYEHYVSTPIQIGAATSPSAILSPLAVTISR